MQDGRAVVEELNVSINAHDFAAGAKLFADKPRLVAATGRVLDMAGYGRLLAATVAAFPDASVRVSRWIVEGDTVVTEEVLQGTHEGPFAGLPPSGRRIRIPMVHVTRVRDGQIVERVTYHDTAAIVRQLDRS